MQNTNYLTPLGLYLTGFRQCNGHLYKISSSKIEVDRLNELFSNCNSGYVHADVTSDIRVYLISIDLNALGIDRGFMLDYDLWSILRGVERDVYLCNKKSVGAKFTESFKYILRSLGTFKFEGRELFIPECEISFLTRIAEAYDLSLLDSHALVLQDDVSSDLSYSGKLLGISGKKGYGKDATAKAISSVSDMPYARVSFGDALKHETSCVLAAQYADRTVDILTFWDRYVECRRKMENTAINPKTQMAHKDDMRGLNVWWGTEWRRNLFAQDWWTIRLIAQVLDLLNNGYLAISTDVRFMNECQILQLLGGKVVRINSRNGFVSDSTHISETALDGYVGFDYVFDNKKDDLQYLKDVARDILSM